MSESEGGGRRADSPRRRARAAVAAERSDGVRALVDPWSPHDDPRFPDESAYEVGYAAPGYSSPGYGYDGGHGSAYDGRYGSAYDGGYGSANGTTVNSYDYESAPYQAPSYDYESAPYQAPSYNYESAPYQAPSHQTPPSGFDGRAATNGAGRHGSSPNGAGTFETAAYGSGTFSTGAVPDVQDVDSARSPYGGDMVGGSLYDLPQATAARSPYEDLLSPAASAAPLPPVVPAPAAPPSPWNGSPIVHRRDAYDGQPDDRPGYDRPESYRPGDDRPAHETATGQLRVVGLAGDEAWLGASAPPRRRGSPVDRGEDVRRGRGGPASRSQGRSRSGRREGSAGVGLVRRMGLGRLDVSFRRSGKERPSEPVTPLQAAVSAGSEVAVVLGMALALSLVIKTLLVQAFFIPSQSMQDTLLIGDRVLVSKLTPGAFTMRRGDVVVFKDPGGWLEPQSPSVRSPVRDALTAVLTFVGLLPQDSGEHLIKRVVGMPGDKVSCCDAKGRVQVNGTPIDESYVRAGNVPSTEEFTVTVKADHLWVMGDNRSESSDSRFHRDIDDGQVPSRNVVGKAFLIVWPFARTGGIAEPPQVFAQVPNAPPSGEQ